VMVAKDGSTNLPRPKAQENRPLEIDRIEFVDGRLDWNSRKLTLDGDAAGVSVQLVHRAADDHYDGSVRIGKASMRMPQGEPLVLSAEAQFRIFHDRIEVPRLRVNQRGWVVEANGVVNDLASPSVQLTYRASGDAVELARLLHYRELKAGRLQLSGQATYRQATGDYAATGKAQAAGVSWENPGVRLEKINGGFNYALDRDHFNISSLFAAALGGTVRGKMSMVHPGKRDSTGRAELQLTKVDFEQTRRAFSTHELPLERLPLAGETAGTLVVNWQGAPQTARLEADLRVDPVARSGQMPLTATVVATVDLKSDVAEVHKLEAHTKGTYLSAEGQLSANSNLKLDFRTAELREMTPLVLAWRGPRAQEMPVEFGGRASFQGKLEGRMQSPAIAGHMVLHDFSTVLRVPARLATGAAAPAAGRVLRNHWDLLQGDVGYSANGEYLRKGLLQSGETKVSLDASVGLVNGDYNANLPFSARVKVENIQALELQRLLNIHYPITGRVSGELSMRGTAARWSGGGSFAMRDATAWAQPLRSASAELELTKNEGGLAGQHARLRNVIVRSDAMQLTADARFNLDTSEFAFDAKGTEIRLEKIQALAERKVALSGTAAFEARGEGTPSAPVINGKLNLRSLVYRGQSLGSLDIDAVTHGPAMKVTARSNFRDAELKLDGEIQLRGQMPLRLTADLQSTHLDSLLAPYLPLRLDQPSEISMHLEASGEAKHLRDMTAALEVTRLAASYGGVAVSNEGAIRMTMQKQVVQVEQFRLSAERGARFLRVRGQVGLGGRREIDLRVDGSVNLKLLETANPNLMSAGAANLNLQVRGTLDRPTMRGRLNVQNGEINYIDFPNGLSDINGSLVFSEDRLQLQELTARTGGGLLHCSGFLSYVPSQGLGFNLSATGQGIRLRYPQGVSSTADATLSLSGTMKNALLSGEITVTRMGLTPRFDFADYLAKGKRGAPVQRIESPLNALHLDVRVTSAQELQVQTSQARMSGNLDLRLRGTAFRPVLLGRVNLIEGQIEFNGTKYRLERGDVTFTNPVRIAPTIDMELSARVRDYDITLGFQGPIEKLNATYRSDPPLSSSDIISLLALGRTVEEVGNPAMMGTSQYQPTVTESASSAIIGQALNATVSSRAQKLFGVSRVKIDPNVGQALSAGLARVTVEQQVSNKLTLTYISNLNQSAQEIIQFEYNVNREVRVVGIRDQNGVVSFDVLFRKRKK
jgi:translocation and assembly module TamB